MLAVMGGAAILSVLPEILLVLTAPNKGWYLGKQTNIDDHMVYAAWMRQAAEGHFFFDNRFTTDPQPGLTVHIYFWLLGLASKFLGYALTEALARMTLTAAFVGLASKLIRKVSPGVFATKLITLMVMLGGGMGFLVWHTFGRTIDKPEAAWATPLFKGRLPIDVWQPEAFVFPSLLTSSLFMVSLCLILTVFLSVLSAQKSWKHVWAGFIGMALLMNVHSYDALLIALVLVGFLVTQLAQGQVTVPWVTRTAVIGSGAVIPALWFVHVIQSDPVFQARANTKTFSDPFLELVAGLGALVVLGVVGMVAQGLDCSIHKKVVGWLIGALIILGYSASYFDPGDPGNHYWMGWASWGALFVVVLGALYVAALDTPAKNLVLAWALVGLLAPYIPELFQRKLTMGIAIPWAILAGLGLRELVKNADRNKRNLATAFVLLLTVGSSIRWFQRELQLGVQNISSTTAHAVFQPSELQDVVAYLQQHKEAHTSVLAIPGLPLHVGPDTFVAPPYIPDLNPFLCGLAGVYSYAGHWSETPRYDEERRGRATSFFLAKTSAEHWVQLRDVIKPDYILAPNPEAFQVLEGYELKDLRSMGQVVVKGPRFSLIKL